MLEIGRELYGFKVKSKKEIGDISATLYELEYIKNGARLLYLDREDSNKTFSIAFKTIPEDSTGVFHIIEHSVLCGSDKYPVKEPFVELLKGSLQTFLNALTFPDKTMYPVSSRNDKDFTNLMSVYLDAVFHPAMRKDPSIFRQEGWHYEISDSGELSRTGVVLNEMRGAYSSPEDVELEYLKQMLYPNTCYRHDSGGAPDKITDLTYEQFVASYKKYYHPSNSYMFLDGSVDLDSSLSLIDSYISEYDAYEIDFDIPDQPPVAPPVRMEEYEVSGGESTKNKTRLSLGFGGWRYDEQMRVLGANVLLDAIMASNESPLKKAILQSGLCEDVELFFCDSVKDNIVCIGFRNVKDGKWEELSALFFDTVKAIADGGIDKELLCASLNSYEFKMRERDFGTMPRGIIYAMSVLETYLYGGDGSENLSFEDSFKTIRSYLNTDYFEKLLSSLFITNPHRATLLMTPSDTLAERRAERERGIMAETSLALGKEGMRGIGEIAKSLKKWQESSDTEEGLATLPTLTRDDISDKVDKIPREISVRDGVTVLVHDIPADGIVYSELYFDVSDLPADEIFDLRLLCSLLSNLPTEQRDTISLQNLIKRELGSFDMRMTALTNKEEVKLYAVASVSALVSKKELISSISGEILLSTVFDEKDTMLNIVRQLKISSEDSFSSAGHQAAIGRAASYILADAAAVEYYSGYEAHTRLLSLEKNFDSEFSSLCARLRALVDRIFTRSRLTLSLVGIKDEGLEDSLIKMLPEGEKCTPVCNIKPLGIRREGIAVPAQVAYAASCANLYELGARPVGSLSVVRGIMSYAYLWNAVRVQGGAYGAGMVSRNNGAIAFYSYRDPSPDRTIGCYGGAAEFLRSFAESGEDITKFIIGAVGDADPLTTPRLRGVLSTTRYLRGVSYEDECKSRRELVMTDRDELLRIADILDKMKGIGAYCIVGGRDKLESAKKYIDTILEIN